MPRAFRTAVQLAIFATAMAGCDSTTGPPAPRMAVISGAGVSDTILTPLAAPLVVRVLDEAGLPALGVPVRFEALRAPFQANPYSAFISAAPDQPRSTAPVVDTTDANGEARVWVQLGTQAGPAHIVADAPAMALSTTATYTVLAGAATAVRVVPADSAMYVGRGYNVRAVVVDWYGNARPEPVTYTPTAPATVGVDGTGRVTAQAIGRGAIIATAGTFRDTAWVSVVPEGVIAAHKFRYSTPDTAAIVFVELDGSEYEEHPIPYWAQPHPDWMPSGDGIVMEDGGGSLSVEESRLVILRPGESSWAPLGGSAGSPRQFHPQYSPEGTWIYFAERNLELWRVRSDGSGAERVGPPTTGYSYDTQPSVSPDGERVVFISNRTCCAPSLMILELASGVVDTVLSTSGLPIPAGAPRWSPTDPDLIAYLDQRIWLTSPDGGTQRALTPQGKRYAGLDWSPDGRWIIAQSSDDGVLHLIEVATGLTLPLGFSNRLGSPTWRP